MQNRLIRCLPSAGPRIARLRELGAGGVRELDGKPEDMVFALPKELRLTLVD